MDLSAIYLKLSDHIKSQKHKYQSLRKALDSLRNAELVCVQSRDGINYYFLDPERLELTQRVNRFLVEPFPYGAQSRFSVRHTMELWPESIFVVLLFSGKVEIGGLEQRYGSLGIKISAPHSSRKTLYIKDIHSIFRLPPGLDSQVLQIKHILQYKWIVKREMEEWKYGTMEALADEFEDAVTGGDGMTSFFSKRLNSEPNDNPVFAEIEKAGLLSDLFTASLSNIERNALLIVLSTLPAILRIILFTKELEELKRLHKAIGISVDGPFAGLLEAYLKEHSLFVTSLEEIEGSTFQEKAINYLAQKGHENLGNRNILELMGMWLLIYLVGDDPSLTLALLRDWGAPFAFIVVGGDRGGIGSFSLMEQKRRTPIHTSAYL